MKTIKEDFFWNFHSKDLDNLAVITEDGEQKTYKQLDKDVEIVVTKLSFQRSLLFLYVNNTYTSLINYLACLRARHPFLLLDMDVAEDLIIKMKESFKPNFILCNRGISKLSNYTHSFKEELAMLMSTSGTTGEAKLVMLSFRNLHHNSESIIDYLKITTTDKAITTLPMSYSYGLSVINTHLGAGASLALNSYGVISREFWNTITENKITNFAGVPFTFQILKKLKYKRFNTSSIRYITQAGGKLDSDSVSYFANECKQLRQEFFVMYGQTEAAPRISYVPAGWLSKKIGSIGLSIPGGKLYLRDGKSNIINEPNVEGEIYYEGKNVMMGYAESVEDFLAGDTQLGVLATGDIGYFDNDGFYYITGRAKRFIKLFGLRISLDAIDNWLNTRGVDAVSTGSDDLLQICFQKVEIYNQVEIISLLAKHLKLNPNYIKAISIDSIPRKNGGKVDFKTLKDLLLQKS